MTFSTYSQELIHVKLENSTRNIPLDALRKCCCLSERFEIPKWPPRSLIDIRYVWLFWRWRKKDNSIFPNTRRNKEIQVVLLVRKSKISRTIRDLDYHLEFLIVSKDSPILQNLYRNITIIVSSMDDLQWFWRSRNRKCEKFTTYGRRLKLGSKF
jgi:hypothetical protein